MKSIDHVITNLDNVTVADVLLCDQISDQKKKKKEKNFNNDAFISDVNKLPLNLVYVADDPEVKVHVFVKLFSQTLEEHAPLKRIKFIRLPTPSLREKCPNTELFLIRIFLYSVGIQENTDQK